MKNLFYYFVYRIAKFYKKTQWALDYVAQGYFLLFFAFTLYALALTHFVLFQFGLGLNKLLIVLFCIPCIIEVLFFQKIFPNNEKVYQECDARYRHENFRWLKGLFVFLFLILSLVCYIFVLIKLKI
jgi:hypothetical protein